MPKSRNELAALAGPSSSRAADDDGPDPDPAWVLLGPAKETTSMRVGADYQARSLPKARPSATPRDRADRPIGHRDLEIEAARDTARRLTAAAYFEPGMRLTELEYEVRIARPPAVDAPPPVARGPALDTPRTAPGQLRRAGPPHGSPRGLDSAAAASALRHIRVHPARPPRGLAPGARRAHHYIPAPAPARFSPPQPPHAAAVHKPTSSRAPPPARSLRAPSASGASRASGASGSRTCARRPRRRSPAAPAAASGRCSSARRIWQ